MPNVINASLAWPPILAALAFGYCLGSIPFGLLFTRFAGLGDIRAVGSGNIGATNVLRTGRKGLAAATLAADMLKGTAAVLVAARWGAEPAMAAAIGAFLGHTFPVWLAFKGGKGVATFIGCLLALKPAAVVAFALIWISVAALTRYSSAGALLASALTPFVLWWLGDGPAAALFAVLALLLWMKHHENLRRLANGTEGKIGRKG